MNDKLELMIALTRRAVDGGSEALREQLTRLEEEMAKSKPSTTKRSGNGSKRKGSKKLKTLSKR